VSDVEQTTRFFTDVLGLDLIARMGGQAGFYSSNAYHHHIGANTWNSRHGSPAGPERAGLQRVVFAISEVAELDRLKLRLDSHGINHDTVDDQTLVSDPDGIEFRFALAT
jgi:catechol 2,3-dioxygenase